MAGYSFLLLKLSVQNATQQAAPLCGGTGNCEDIGRDVHILPRLRNSKVNAGFRAVHSHQTAVRGCYLQAGILIVFIHTCAAEPRLFFPGKRIAVRHSIEYFFFLPLVLFEFLSSGIAHIRIYIKTATARKSGMRNTFGIRSLYSVLR